MERKAAITPTRTRGMDGVKLGSWREDAGRVEGPNGLQVVVMECGSRGMRVRFTS